MCIFYSLVFPQLPLGVAPQLSLLAGSVFLFTYLQPSSYFFPSALSFQFPYPDPLQRREGPLLTSELGPFSSFIGDELTSVVWSVVLDDPFSLTQLVSYSKMSWSPCCCGTSLTFQAKVMQCTKYQFHAVLPLTFPCDLEKAMLSLLQAEASVLLDFNAKNLVFNLFAGH